MESFLQLIGSSLVLVGASVPILALLLVIKDPEAWMRFSTRANLVFQSESRRGQLAKKNVRVAYFYLGTTGDEEKDARIRHRTRLYGRMIGIGAIIALLIAAIVSVVGSFLF